MVPLSLTLSIGEVDVEEEILNDLNVEEIPPPSPQMSRPELAKLSETLRLACMSACVEAAYDFSKVLR